MFQFPRIFSITTQSTEVVHFMRSKLGWQKSNILPRTWYIQGYNLDRRLESSQGAFQYYTLMQISPDCFNDSLRTMLALDLFPMGDRTLLITLLFLNSYIKCNIYNIWSSSEQKWQTPSSQTLAILITGSFHLLHYNLLCMYVCQVSNHHTSKIDKKLSK